MKKILLVALSFILAFGAFTAMPEKADAATPSTYYKIDRVNGYSKIFSTFTSGQFDGSVYNIGNNGRQFQIAFEGGNIQAKAAVGAGDVHWEIQLKTSAFGFSTYKNLYSDPGLEMWYVKLGSAFPNGTYRIKMTVDSPHYLTKKVWYSGRFTVN